MKFSSEFREYVSRAFERRQEKLGEKREDIQKALSGCTETENLLLRFLYATMPLTDIGDYSPALFLDFIRHGLKVQELFPWCARLSESCFLKDVLYPRINTEELVFCRDAFLEELRPRVQGLDLPEAILEVNRWCAENVTYRSTDACTASPWAVYERGYGRCGEESSFTVTALRSVGIAARQIYAPWWSHCDDNHAWVEAFDGNTWRFLGACEPEPTLDRGWFTSAASRAMLIHTRVFVQGSREEWAFLFPHRDGLDLSFREGVVYENVLNRYAENRPVTLRVLDESGQAVQGAFYQICVLNMGRFSEISAGYTDACGQAMERLGFGSVYVYARSKTGQWGQCVATVAKPPYDGIIELTVQREPQAPQRIEDFSFEAPKDAVLYPAELTKEQKEMRKAVLEKAARLREAKQRKREAGPVTPDLLSQRLLGALSEKDRAGAVSPDILDDMASALQAQGEFPTDVFEQALLSQRVGFEVLTAYRSHILEFFSEEDQDRFAMNPLTLWAWIQREISLCEDSYEALWGTPKGILSLKAATSLGRRLLFVAVCRALDVPARLALEDAQPEYYRNGIFHSVCTKADLGRLVLSAEEGEFVAGKTYGVSRETGDGWVCISLPDVTAGDSVETSLPAGAYRIYTVNRLPGGSQLVRQFFASVEGGKEKSVTLSMVEGNIKDMLESRALPDFSLTNHKGEAHCAGEIVCGGLHVVLWLEVGREPTEHILNELHEAKAAFSNAPCTLHAILEKETDSDDHTLGKVRAVLPEMNLWVGDFQDQALLARRMYVDPDRLPLVLLIKDGKGLYACCGYNVGTAELLLRMLEEFSC